MIFYNEKPQGYQRESRNLKPKCFLIVIIKTSSEAEGINSPL